MTSGRALIAAVALVILPATAMAQLSTSGQTEEPPGVRAAAVQSLQTYRRLALSSKFGAPGAAAQAELGSPIYDYMIGLDALAKWKGDDFSSLLHPTGRVIYPITSNGEPQSSVTLSKKDEGWHAVEFGSFNEAKARSEAQEAIAGSGPGGQPAKFQVRVSALNVSFLASQLAGKTMLTAMGSQPRLGIEAGKTEPAMQVMLRLQHFAREINPDVPN